MNMQIGLRAAAPSDDAFLRHVHAAAHCAGFSSISLAPAALAALLRLQFDAQQAQYRARYPEAVDHLIIVNGDSVGRCWTHETSGELRLLDLAVLPAYQRRGIAGSVLDDLLERARGAGLPFRLSVWSGNAPALALYRSHGIEIIPAAGSNPSATAPAPSTGHAPGYRDLEWTPTMSRVS